MNFKHILLFATAIVSLTLTSCLKGENDEYELWRSQNDEYLASTDLSEYTLVVPDWAPQNSVYIKWHNDRKLTEKNLVAKSNSTVDMKYELFDIEGNALGNSYSNTDSVYQSKPNNNIVGMWIAMTTMHEGDSATLIIPYPSAYGASSQGSVKPYSNLIYRIKIQKIRAFEKPLN